MTNQIIIAFLFSLQFPPVFCFWSKFWGLLGLERSKCPRDWCNFGFQASRMNCSRLCSNWLVQDWGGRGVVALPSSFTCPFDPSYVLSFSVAFATFPSLRTRHWWCRQVHFVQASWKWSTPCWQALLEWNWLLILAESQQVNLLLVSHIFFVAHLKVAGEDVLYVFPTGAGKSLCYQLPALLSKGKSLG